MSQVQASPLAVLPAQDGAPVTTSDTVDLPKAPTRALYIGGAGDLVVIMSSGATLTFKAVPVGSVLPFAVDRVKATGTAATFIVALY